MVFSAPGMIVSLVLAAISFHCEYGLVGDTKGTILTVFLLQSSPARPEASLSRVPSTRPNGLRSSSFG